ncbi:hypothetical protein MANES_08G003400v8 [Manihot esculenta]|uniref:Uncharacterized protein n=1 Tax=Manihot esculenta TaxID=3983 RepID=A0ACB7H717_MANES|nr:hypothetical protein MANES_08G003400v8 [Manihot esculenta]
MSEPEENFGLEDKILSLIDVCFEDDCLYNSPFRDQLPPFSDDQTRHRTVQMVGVHALEDSFGGDKPAVEPFESAEQEKARKNEKYNLRKSLAWDSAFFTSAGVLEPEELSSIIGGNEKGGKNHILPGIQEDIQISTDSISTFATDNSTLGTLEDELFGDIRASIQKSCKGSNKAVSHGKAGSGVNEGQFSNPSEKVDIVAQNKLKTKAAPRKPNVGSGKLANESGFTNGESTSFLPKPAKIVGRVSPILSTATRIANNVKVEKDSHLHTPKTLTVRGAKLPTTGGSRNTVPKPTFSSKSSLRSSVASASELTTSSSVDSLGSLTSDSSSRCSLNSMKRKIDSKTANHSSTVSTAKSTLRITSRSKNQSMRSHISPHLKSVTKAKLSASISPASSISEWSLGSMSPTSTLNKRINSSKSSLNTSSCKDAYDNGDALQVLHSQNQSSDRCSVGLGTQAIGLPSEHGKRVATGSGAVVWSDSIIPSGLRMPSPKIGFFDGVRSTVRTSTENTESHPALRGGSSRYWVENVSPSGRSNQAKFGKLQPAKTALAVRGTKERAPRTASESKPKSPLPLQSPSTASKVTNASRNGKHYPVVPLKVQNRISPGTGGQDKLKAEKIAPRYCDIAIKNPDIDYAEKNDNLHKNKTSPYNENKGSVKDEEVFPILGGLGVACSSRSVSEAENITLSQKMGKSATYGQNKILGSLANTNEKEISLEDQVDDLASQIGVVDIHREPAKTCSWLFSSSC